MISLVLTDYNITEFLFVNFQFLFHKCLADAVFIHSRCWITKNRFIIYLFLCSSADMKENSNTVLHHMLVHPNIRQEMCISENLLLTLLWILVVWRRWCKIYELGLECCAFAWWTKTTCYVLWYNGQVCLAICNLQILKWDIILFSVKLAVELSQGDSMQIGL